MVAMGTRWNALIHHFRPAPRHVTARSQGHVARVRSDIWTRTPPYHRPNGIQKSTLR